MAALVCSVVFIFICQIGVNNTLLLGLAITWPLVKTLPDHDKREVIGTELGFPAFGVANSCTIPGGDRPGTDMGQPPHGTVGMGR